jgi:hypothetical protein
VIGARASRPCAAVLAVFVLVVLAAPVASAQLLLGIGDESPAIFANTAFLNLGVNRVRLIVPYNVAVSSKTAGATDAWMAGAYFDHEQVAVAFNPASGSGCPGQPCVLPSSSQFTKAFLAFRKRYPAVKIYQPWNEVNSLTQPTQAHPQAVVSFYGIVKKNCRGCTVLGADLEDLTTPHQSNLVVYAKQLLADFKKAHIATPQIWGLHNYVDTNYFTDSGTAAALKTLPGQIWLTETGGIAQFILSSGTVRLQYDLNRQAKATRWLIHLATTSRRITRAYIYDFLYANVQGERFDSSLMGPGQVPRQSYYVLTAHYANYFQ